jgi:hypothetical protein
MDENLDPTISESHDDANSFEENKNLGWVKLYRSVLQNNLFDDHAVLAVFIKILLLASHKPYRKVHKGGVYFLKPGEVYCSESFLQKSLKLSRKQVQRVILLLVKCGVITKKANKQGTIISVNKWDTYQTNEKSEEQRRDNEGTTKGHNTRIKEVKNERIKNKIYLAQLTALQAGLCQSWIEFSKTQSKTKIDPNPEEYAKAVLDIERLCSIDTQRLIDVLSFVRSDPFWAPNAISLPRLLGKSKTNGVRKIENILQSMDRLNSEHVGIPKLTEEAFNQWVAKNGTK